MHGKEKRRGGTGGQKITLHFDYNGLSGKRLGRGGAPLQHTFVPLMENAVHANGHTPQTSTVSTMIVCIYSSECVTYRGHRE